MAWQPELARGAQRRRSWFTCAGQVMGVAAFFTLGFGSGFGFCEARLAFLGMDRGGRLSAGFAMFASFTFGANEHGGMEAFLFPAHSPSPRF